MICICIMKNFAPRENMDLTSGRRKYRTDGLTSLIGPLKSIREQTARTIDGTNDTANAIFNNDGSVYFVKHQIANNDRTFPMTKNELLKATF